MRTNAKAKRAWVGERRCGMVAGTARAGAVLLERGFTEELFTQRNAFLREWIVRR